MLQSLFALLTIFYHKQLIYLFFKTETDLKMVKVQFVPYDHLMHESSLANLQLNTNGPNVIEEDCLTAGCEVFLNICNEFVAETVK